MMRNTNQVIMRNFSIIVIVSSIAISAITCAPQIQQQQQIPNQVASSPMQQQQQQQQMMSLQQENSMQPMMINNQRQQQQQQQATTTSTTPINDQSSLAPEASVATGQPSLGPQASQLFNSNDQQPQQQQSSAEQKDGAAQSSASSETAQSAGSNELPTGNEFADLFDGRNPFTDSSLWQIPLQLVSEFAAAEAAKQSDQMANSASETSSLNEDDDEEPAQSAPIRSPQQSAPAPKAVQKSIAPESAPAPANNDLKTAAGYHYPTHNSHHKSHHGGGSQHGGHYGGGGEVGHGYFQYASVPKPKAWQFGYKRGNSKHTIERYEKGHGPHFTTKVKWSDKHGHGSHTWDYNHDDQHSHGYDDHHDHEHHHEPQQKHHYHGHHQQKKYQPKKHY